MKPFKVCTKNTVVTLQNQNRGLTPNTWYHMIEIADSYFRVINDNDEPILYPNQLFVNAKQVIPDGWVKISIDDETTYTLEEFSARYFFEDYFDGNQANIEVYKNFLLGLKTSKN